MPVKQTRPSIPLPSGWRGRVKSAVLHTISLAHFSIVHAREMAAGHIRRRARLAQLYGLKSANRRAGGTCPSSC